MAQYFIDASDHANQTPLSDIGFDVAGSTITRSRVTLNGNSATGSVITFNQTAGIVDYWTDSSGAGDQEILLIGDIPPNALWLGNLDLEVELREGVKIGVNSGTGWANTGLDSVSNNTGAPAGYSNTTPYAMRIQVIGTAYKARFWQDAGGISGLETNEPATWNYEGTAAAPLTGKIGVTKDGGGGATHIGIATAGDTAPFEPVPEPFIAVPTNLTVDQITSNSARLNWTAG